MLRDELHHGLVDLALEELHEWLVHNPETVAEILGERAPWWTPTRLNDAVTSRIHLELVRWVGDIRDDPRHHARQALDSMLAQLSTDLLEDPETQARTDRLKHLAVGRAAPGAADLPVRSRGCGAPAAHGRAVALRRAAGGRGGAAVASGRHRRRRRGLRSRPLRQ